MSWFFGWFDKKSQKNTDPVVKAPSFGIPAPAPQPTPAPIAAPETATKVELVLRAIGVSAALTEKWVQPIARGLDHFGITDDAEIAHMLAQFSHESGDYKYTSENLNYRSTTLRKLWPHRFSEQAAHQYGKRTGQRANKQIIAQIAYGGRMGNRAHPSPDGWNYRGRGLIQITGKNNYTAIANVSGLDIVNNPDLLNEPENAARCSIAWWVKNGCAKFAKANDVKRLTKRINGGYSGLAHRTALTKKALTALS